MRAGLLTELIDVYRPDVEINNYGEQVTELHHQATIRARQVTHRQSRTNENGDTWLPNAITLEVRIYQPIEDYDIIQWNGKDYRIITIEVDKLQRCKRLTIEEVNQ